ncbi:2,3-diketo-5-methylthio-1-phosphopentane phosphatase [Xylona heveae TC161]|uniref:2,3-diketo-5-methylthio-1-phosphopentane phosphatase n=1 Tax=Xylona heveae (strain CBS 132557 / TC161) TaxID=1328760 RepID=A0A164ZK45_XYLHT|nr:2,3-diketo-5-methylthio-1-phosphopentane phosphatase [Xylona heveae TC161]KZF19193.1 2,3-diketo-5-methylthio-1-phosphopentane phosphatase [Xylona heveae TC161]
MAGQKIKAVVLDIEGTVCPISFVKDVLFPYSLHALPSVLSTQWDSPSFAPFRDAFPAEARTSPAAFEAHVHDLTAKDVKIAYLKGLQGYLYQHGYATGALKTPFFRDVAPSIKRWKEDSRGLMVGIYSSGSISAQKLLFRYAALDTAASATTNAASSSASKGALTESKGAENEEENEAEEKKGTETEDLTPLLSAYYDTTTAGYKAESSSYTYISRDLDLAPEEILFLSDSVKEVVAARAAGLRAKVVVREGNPVLSDEEMEQAVENGEEIVTSLEDVDV